jgi:excisionase family DNA binding protein
MEVIVDERLLTPEQVAELLALKPQTVRDAAWRGKLPCVRLWRGRRKSLLRFLRSDIDTLIRERSVPANKGAR